MESLRMERVYSEWRTQRGQRPGGGTLEGAADVVGATLGAETTEPPGGLSWPHR